MNILGIDPGLATTGYAVIKKEGRQQVQALDWGVIATEKHQALAERLHMLGRDLELLLKHYKPKTAVVESIYFAKNKKTAIAVAQARGAIIATLSQQRLSIVELTPLQIKMRLTGYGSASKQQVQFMVKKLLSLKTTPHPDDAADALAAALCAS